MKIRLFIDAIFEAFVLPWKLTMVETAILDSTEYPTSMELWRSLPKKMKYQTFKHIVDYLEASGKITFSDGKIIYTGVSNTKLQALQNSAVRVR